MRTFVTDGQTDGRTDGAGFIRTRERVLTTNLINDRQQTATTIKTSNLEVGLA